MTPVRPHMADAAPAKVEPPRARSRRGGASCRDDRGPALYAALDLGTNSCRMLIARPEGASFVVTDSFSRAVQLGLGLEVSGRLGRAPMARSVQALRVCRAKLESWGVRRMRLVATEACRRALNGRDFLRAVRREAGLNLEIITPEEEARLAVVSCAPLVRPETERLLIVDIGGGSTELVWIDLEHIAPTGRAAALLRLGAGFAMPDPLGARVVDWISVPHGVATLRDQFRDVEDDCARFALMSWFFEENLTGFSPYHHDVAREGFQIIGTSGTVTTVAATWLGLRRYDRSLVDGLEMTGTQVDAVIREYLALGPEGRQRDPRIGRDRQTLIMPGVAILQALLRVWPSDRVSVADRGLREGLLYSQMSADGVLDEGVAA